MTERERLQALAQMVVDTVPCLTVSNWPPGFELKKSLLAAARAALALPKEEAGKGPGEGGPCAGCRTPFMAKAADVVWDGNGHGIGVATCPRCQYPALVKLDSAAQPSGSVHVDDGQGWRGGRT